MEQLRFTTLTFTDCWEIATRGSEAVTACVYVCVCVCVCTCAREKVYDCDCEVMCVCVCVGGEGRVEGEVDAYFMYNTASGIP